jgi:protocatechuate 3,4-dioxygenase beta subunit
MTRAATVTCLLAFAAGLSAAQDAAWVRAWEQAQAARPGAIASDSRIAPPDEPGTQMVIDGRVMQPDGRTPAANVTVFAYQTDANGLYDDPANGPHSWRLRGWARTDAQGRFVFRTIRPAPYPANRIPAHVHFTIEGPTLQRRSTPELRFTDDQFVPADQRAASERAGTFGNVRPVETRDGVQHVEFSIRISEDGRF